MTHAQTSETKAVVARLYEAFNAGDTEALGELLADDMINHNPGMTNGRVVSQAALRQIGSMKVEVHRIIAEGDLVAVHAHYKTPTEGAGMDFFKVVDGRIVEHWDVRQDIPITTASGQDMFSELTGRGLHQPTTGVTRGPARVAPGAGGAARRALVRSFGRVISPQRLHG
jgi:predicted SnoaL-like aldol condensation-catalyzing enzyme